MTVDRNKCERDLYETTLKKNKNRFNEDLNLYKIDHPYEGGCWKNKKKIL